MQTRLLAGLEITGTQMNLTLAPALKRVPPKCWAVGRSRKASVTGWPPGTRLGPNRELESCSVVLEWNTRFLFPGVGTQNLSPGSTHYSTIAMCLQGKMGT